ncbi:translation initiation factor SU [Macroventuria anomochaeta]|uniref:Translation initiation factor SU n=1 Tax=Macroventuria anomochaeta TaxID=301207 RepID=A0ACB6RYK0_9PLEO|nr:translation initiation factor SU [Macroventuria anomochaeta]KAF2625957.1 translation initiation factor SU [Macroventuria anomochaeta]
MASLQGKKDMRRADLIVPYAEPAKDKSDGDMSSTMASTLPMAAIFTRNKMIGWVSVVFSVQSWLAETPEQKKTSTTPAYFSVGMAVMSLLVSTKRTLYYSQLYRHSIPCARNNNPTHSAHATLVCMSIENLKTFDPFAEADEGTGEKSSAQSQDYIHIRIQQRNGRKTLTTVQGLPKKFDQKKILKVIKKKFACNGTIVADTEMGEVVQLQGDQRKDIQDFLTDKKEGLGLDAKTIKVHGF